jgi:hypothetical protein
VPSELQVAGVFWPVARDLENMEAARRETGEEGARRRGLRRRCARGRNLGRKLGRKTRTGSPFPLTLLGYDDKSRIVNKIRSLFLSPLIAVPRHDFADVAKLDTVQSGALGTP